MGQDAVFLSQKATGHPYNPAGGRSWRGSGHPCPVARCCFLKCEVRIERDKGGFFATYLST